MKTKRIRPGYYTFKYYHIEAICEKEGGWWVVKGDCPGRFAIVKDAKAYWDKASKEKFARWREKKNAPEPPKPVDPATIPPVDRNPDIQADTP
jgi:hypothetical protein